MIVAAQVAAIKAYQALGEQEKAQALMDELISAIIASPSLTYHDSAIQDASIYALAGQEETAIAILGVSRTYQFLFCRSLIILNFFVHANFARLIKSTAYTLRPTGS